MTKYTGAHAIAIGPTLGACPVSAIDFIARGSARLHSTCEKRNITRLRKQEYFALTTPKAIEQVVYASGYFHHHLAPLGDLTLFYTIA